MSILVDKNSRLVVQGITGREGAFHTEQMLAYGTPVVAGVTPGKGGGWAVGNVPIFDSTAEAVAATGANVSIIYVPARFAPDAILEAADAGIVARRQRDDQAEAGRDARQRHVHMRRRHLHPDGRDVRARTDYLGLLDGHRRDCRAVPLQARRAGCRRSAPVP